MIVTPVTSAILRGALELEHTAHGVLPHRLPAWARAQCADPQLASAEAKPAGVRLAFRTEATAVELDAFRTAMEYRGIPPRPDGVYDVLVNGVLVAQAGSSGGDTQVVDVTNGTVQTRPGPVQTLRFAGLPAEAKDVEIWLPHNERVELVALRTNAPIRPIPDRGRRIWLHHGSSISQGSNAVSPTTTWPVLAAAGGDVALINLGLSGSAVLDPFTARTMRDTPADLVSVKIGINVVNTDAMRLRAFTPAVHGFIDAIRDGHPAVPLLVISPLLCPIHEDTPGPGAFDLEALPDGPLRFRATGDPADRATGKLTLNVIRAELARIVAQRAADDPNLYYLDGRALYGEADYAELPLPDRLHPDTATHRRIAERFVKLAFGPRGPFADLSSSRISRRREGDAL